MFVETFSDDDYPFIPTCSFFVIMSPKSMKYIESRESGRNGIKHRIIWRNEPQDGKVYK